MTRAAFAEILLMDRAPNALTQVLATIATSFVRVSVTVLFYRVDAFIAVGGRNCQHAFHLHCIEQWITSNTQNGTAVCPMCRREW